MGFLGRVSKESGQQPGTTVIAGATKVVGDLQLSDDFHLDGCMAGKLNSSHNVTIGIGGEFDGEICAHKVVVSGRIDGSVDAERLEIVSSGKVSGEIRVAELVIEPGGQFNGSSHIKSADTQPPRRISHQPESGNEATSPSRTEDEPDKPLQATGS